ncbi:DUF2231 domain-containing protein [Methylobacillus arboreus]|uniref:DUF2231 domain-containing protein n=1 Tax=Methylobacillus arboreus TaxID=755170 RepID=UPI001E349B3B|nr:DUF2231 domain-containing protein [Methylobacillus arboreus]MCB5191467.1 DUF2231 domain-containing protein [Methylobacillus arboreus]
MDPVYSAGSGTKAAFRRHPLHPMLVSLPIGFLIGALASDIAFAVLENPFWAEASFWLLIAGVAGGILAGITGIIELLGVRRARRLPMAWLHGLINLGVLGVTFANIWLRSNDIQAILPFGLGLSLVTGAMLGVSGWLGGEMTFRHGIGVSEQVGDPQLDEGKRKVHVQQS